MHRTNKRTREERDSEPPSHVSPSFCRTLVSFLVLLRVVLCSDHSLRTECGLDQIGHCNRTNVSGLKRQHTRQATNQQGREGRE